MLSEVQDVAGLKGPSVIHSHFELGWLTAIGFINQRKFQIKTLAFYSDFCYYWNGVLVYNIQS